MDREISEDGTTRLKFTSTYADAHQTLVEAVFACGHPGYGFRNVGDYYGVLQEMRSATTHKTWDFYKGGDHNYPLEAREQAIERYSRDDEGRLIHPEMSSPEHFSAEMDEERIMGHYREQVESHRIRLKDYEIVRDAVVWDLYQKGTRKQSEIARLAGVNQSRVSKIIKNYKQNLNTTDS